MQDNSLSYFCSVKHDIFPSTRRKLKESKRKVTNHTKFLYSLFCLFRELTERQRKTDKLLFFNYVLINCNRSVVNFSEYN